MPPKSISQMKLNSQVGSSCGIIESFQIEPVSVQFTCSVVSITKSWSLLRLMPIESALQRQTLLATSSVKFSPHLASMTTLSPCFPPPSLTNPHLSVLPTLLPDSSPGSTVPTALCNT